jgi:hypothetical protein
MNSFSVNIVDAMYVLDVGFIPLILKARGLWRDASVDGGGNGYKELLEVKEVREPWDY